MDLQKVASLRQAASQVPPEVHAKWRHAFQSMDADNTGTIDPSELENIMRSLNMVPAPGEITAMIAAVDHNEDNVIDFEEFEMMMISSGRGGNGSRHGFSHVVERFIRMKEIARLVAQECKNMAQVFADSHASAFADLPAGPVSAAEQNPAWYDTFQMFQEQAELTLQNVLLLWGVANQKSFETDFIEAVGDRGDLLEDFLSLTDYPSFLRFMQRRQQQQQQQGSEEQPVAATPRPEAPLAQSQAQKRLAQLDQRLAVLDHERNAVLAERRRLVGCEVLPVTTGALKQVLEMRRWKEDVGND